MAQPPHREFLRDVLAHLHAHQGEPPTCDDCGKLMVLVPCPRCGTVCQWQCPLILAYQVNKKHDLRFDDGHEPGSEEVEVFVATGAEDLINHFDLRLWHKLAEIPRRHIIRLVESTPVSEDPNENGIYGHVGFYPRTAKQQALADKLLARIREDPDNVPPEVWGEWTTLANRAHYEDGDEA